MCALSFEILGTFCLIIIIINQINANFNEVPFCYDSLFSTLRTTAFHPCAQFSSLPPSTIHNKKVCMCMCMRAFVPASCLSIRLPQFYCQTLKTPLNDCVYVRVCVFITYATHACLWNASLFVFYTQLDQDDDKNEVNEWKLKNKMK